MKKILLPPRFSDWAEYGDRYNVDVLGDDLRCRKCGEVWPLRYYNRTGKLVQRAHVCPYGCNGKPRVRSGSGYAPAVVVNRQRARWEESHGWKGGEYPGPDHSADDWPSDAEEARWVGRERRRQTKMWFTFRVASGSPGLTDLLRLFDEAAEDLGDDSFLDSLSEAAGSQT